MLKPIVSLLAALMAVPAANTQPATLTSAPSPTGSFVTAALDDATIVAIFDAANTWDIETSQLAIRTSRNKGVRDFAAMMIRDHSAVRQLGRDLAKRLHVTPTPPGKDFPLAVDHASIMKTLRATRGAAFDKAYVDHEVWYHQAVIDAISKQLLPATKNAELKDLEIKVAPSFEAHLVAAKALQKTLGR